jgi:TonB family protein
MFGYVLALLLPLQSVGQAAPQDDIKETLARAEALYYQARFSDSIQLLMGINDSLRTKPDRLPDRITTKLQLALDNIGLNDTAQAKTFLVEMYALDADYNLDPQQFSPKVITLANDAKAEQQRIRCQTSGEDARKLLKAGNGEALLTLIESTKSKCAEVAATQPEAAELLYKSGLDAYKKGDFSNALQDFKGTLQLSPKHDLATQYVELTESKVQVAEDRALLEWHRNFEAHQLTQAAANYGQLVSFNRDTHSQSVTQVGAEYRKALSSLVDAWNQACPTNDALALTAIQKQITELLPQPSFGADLRAQMGVCNKPAEKIAAAPKPAEPKAAPADAGCFQMDTAIALARLKTRIDPEFPADVRSYIQNTSMTVVVKTQIDETGNVTAVNAQGGNARVNAAVLAAVKLWKFAPAVGQNGARCVNTEIPIVFGSSSARK